MKIISHKGFTLVELLVVMFIIGVLAAIVIVSVDQSRARSRDARRRADLATIKNAVEQFADKKASYTITWTDGTGGETCSGAGTGTPCTTANGYFNDSYAAPASGHSIASALVSWGFVSAELMDPLNKGKNKYMFWSIDNQYCIYAKLEKPGTLVNGFDSTGVTTLSKGYSASYEMNYAVGNNCVFP